MFSILPVLNVEWSIPALVRMIAIGYLGLPPSGSIFFSVHLTLCTWMRRNLGPYRVVQFLPPPSVIKHACGAFIAL